MLFLRRSEYPSIIKANGKKVRDKDTHTKQNIKRNDKDTHLFDMTKMLNEMNENERGKGIATTLKRGILFFELKKATKIPVCIRCIHDLAYKYCHIEE